MVFFFLFKQKTAYEMRISDWSSDVCSSDLVAHSREMDSAIVLLATIGIFKFAGGYMWTSLESLTVDTWAHLGRNPLTIDLTRSEERRVGKECVSPCRSRG